MGLGHTKDAGVLQSLSLAPSGARRHSMEEMNQTPPVATRYPARAVRDPEAPHTWLLELIDEPRVHTFATSLTLALVRMRDGVRLWYGLPPGAVCIPLDFGDAPTDAALRALEAAYRTDDSAARQRATNRATRRLQERQHLVPGEISTVLAEVR